MSGYIGASPVPQATQHRQAFTATASQTSFATVGYTPQFVDVYLNGVKLAAADYTATNGSDIVLTTGAALNDILEIVAYTPFEVADQTFTGTTTVTDSGAAPLVANRTISNGGIIDLQKDGTTVGNIGVEASAIYMGKAETGVQFIAGSADRVVPYNTTTQAFNDGGISLGYPDARWSNLYLSGGVYLGGTGAANKLDDYEEGTWTPTVQGGTTAGTATYAKQLGRYVKIGGLVHIQAYMQWSSFTGVGPHQFGGLPFPATGSNYYSGVSLGYSDNFSFGASGSPMMHVQPSDTYIWIGAGVNNSGWVNTFCDASGDVIIGGTYYTDS